MVKESWNLISNFDNGVERERERERDCLMRGYVGDWVANVNNLPCEKLV